MTLLLTNEEIDPLLTGEMALEVVERSQLSLAASWAISSPRVDTLGPAMRHEAEVLVYHLADYSEVIPDRERVFGDYKKASSEVPLKPVVEFKKGRQKKIEKLLREDLCKLSMKVNVHAKVDIAEPVYEQIVEKAEKEGLAMIVMFTHGRWGLERIVIGSVTERVVRRSTCPVLSVRSINPKKTKGVALRRSTQCGVARPPQIPANGATDSNGPE